ncbi:Kef-type K+ transport system membrane component KefB [Pontibacter aydingkolensis]|uniref:Cation:proton antiporter n=1 Tax=Pontibacter aydingkolensis TaxID=1911536 RepID=A0ABS7CZF4_9BACT|nr:cation:proton antiporter [Pontibacter aydingkolensis]MBW7469224.1 cation:proton antiporter [Pontibacter aydingkolensis]
MENIELVPFYEFSIILILAAILGAIGQLLRQPLIVIFIALGILVGPSVLNLVESTDKIHLLSDLGIAILLFVVGLKLDLNLIRSMGKVAIITGLGQVIFTSVFGFIIGLLLGYSILFSLYIAIALTFSSTIIIVKLLSDKKEIDSLHGQIAIGFLIVQDLVVVLLMISLTALDRSAEGQLGYNVLRMLGKGMGLALIFALLMIYVIPTLVHYLAKSQELLVLFAIAWAVAAASVSDVLGFSREVGAFLAGVSLASTQYRNVLSGRLVSIRDFLLLFFFIHLGLHLDLGLIGNQVGPALLFSLFVLIGNPLIVMVIMGLMGYRKRTSFLAGLTVAQISEFSLIFAALGFNLGHINQETVGLITLVGLITIGLSTYMIIYSHTLFAWLSPILSIFEKKIPYREDMSVKGQNIPIDAILFGLGRFGGNIALSFLKEGYRFIAVDFDPKQVQYWQKQGIQAQYGDIEDPELPDQLPLQKASVVVSSIADLQLNLGLIKMLKMNNYNGKIAVTAHRASDALALQAEKETAILLPFTDAAESVPDKLFKFETT